MTELAQGKLTPDNQASGSMLASLMGLNPYQTPNDCLINAFRAIDNGGKLPPGDWQYIEPADWGNKFENTILKEMAQRLGIVGNFDIKEPVQHSDLPLAVSLDGIGVGDGKIIRTDKKAGIYCFGADEISLNGPGVLEAKLTGAPPSDDPKPFRGPIQVEGGLMCTGFEWAAIGTLYRGTELRIYVLAVDSALRAKITADVIDFQRRLDLWEIQGEKDFYPALHPNDAASTWENVVEGDAPIELSEELSELALEYSDAMEAGRAITKVKQNITPHLMNALGKSQEAIIFEDGKEVGKVLWGLNKARDAHMVKGRPSSRSKSIKVVINE